MPVALFGDAGGLTGALSPRGIRSAARERTSRVFVNACLHGSGALAEMLSVTLRSGASVSCGFVAERTLTPVDEATPGHYGLFDPGVDPAPAIT